MMKKSSEYEATQFIVILNLGSRVYFILSFNTSASYKKLFFLFIQKEDQSWEGESEGMWEREGGKEEEILITRSLTECLKQAELELGQD